MAQRRHLPSAAGAVHEQLSRLGHRPAKRLGQHFLCDPAVAERIVALGGLRSDDAVVEIGPGLGVLSDLLAHAVSRLFLVELDAELAGHLIKRYRELPQVRVLNEDALRVDFALLLAGLPPAVAIGNLPYNVATPILMRVVEHHAHFRRFVFMLQREVAERIAAQPGTRSYGVLSVMTQLHCNVHVGLDVPPECFVPTPKVASAVVVVDPLPAPRVDVPDPGRFQAVVRGLFQHRRKQLVNAGRGILRAPLESLRAAGIDPTRRPETLSLEEFSRLVREAC